MDTEIRVEAWPCRRGGYVLHVDREDLPDADTLGRLIRQAVTDAADQPVAEVFVIG